MAQHTITCQCTEDSYVDRNYPNNNYGTSNSLLFNSYNVDANKITNKCAFLKFSIPSLILIKRIISVTLKVYAIKDGRLCVAAFKCVWDENTITYANSISRTERQFILDFPEESSVFIPSNSWSDVILPANLVQQNLRNIYDYGLELLNSTIGSVEAEIASRHTGNAPTIIILYEDVPPDKPTLIDPVNAYKDNVSVIRFEWIYNSSVGGIQKGFDLQWSTNNSTWTTISQTTSNNYYDMPENTVPTGIIYWRVQTYNECDEVSGYSDSVAFYSIGAPATPVITSVSYGTARPTITWVSSQQQVYQVQILQSDTIMYDSGVLPGILNRTHKIKTFLPDGIYTARVRIKNEYDLWSPWGETSITISTVKPTKPAFTIQRVRYGLRFDISGISGAAYALLYRDNVCVGKVASTTVFIDTTVVHNQEYRYFIRAVSADETYMDSDISLGKAELKYSLIAPASDTGNIIEFNRSLNAPPRRSYQRNIVTTGVYYSGREYPVNEPAEFMNASLNLAFFLKEYSQLQEFINLYDRKETVLYRDSKGRKIYGTLNGLSVNDERFGFSISFTITQVDYTEELEV